MTGLPLSTTYLQSTVGTTYHLIFVLDPKRIINMHIALSCTNKQQREGQNRCRKHTANRSMLHQRCPKKNIRSSNVCIQSTHRKKKIRKVPTPTPATLAIRCLPCPWRSCCSETSPSPCKCPHALETACHAIATTPEPCSRLES